MSFAEQRPTDPVNEELPRSTAAAAIVGKVAMPSEAKEIYYLAKNSEQLVIPRWADPFDTDAIEVA